MADAYQSSPADRFSVGLWCTAYRGREVFRGEVHRRLDPDIDELVAGPQVADHEVERLGRSSPRRVARLRQRAPTWTLSPSGGVACQRLDQLVIDLLTRVR